MTPEQKEEIRMMIRDELRDFLATSTYRFSKDLDVLDGRNIRAGIRTGTQFGTDPTQKIAVYGTTPGAQITPTNLTTVASGGGGSAVLVDTTFTGGIGSTAFTVTDVVYILKKFGILKL